LEIDVVAEGIESAEQLELLQAWGCREGQGFYLARPLGVRELEPLLARGGILPGHQVPARTAA
jgi:EAL domain-containing protein (putative c-di-GMP-specific phosphodiesterase class I)